MWIATLPISGILSCVRITRSISCMYVPRPFFIGFNKFYNTRSTALPCIAARSVRGGDSTERRARRSRQCLVGFPDSPLEAIASLRCGKVHSQRRPVRVRRVFLDDPLGWQSRSEDPARRLDSPPWNEVLPGARRLQLASGKQITHSSCRARRRWHRDQLQ